MSTVYWCCRQSAQADSVFHVAARYLFDLALITEEEGDLFLPAEVDVGSLIATIELWETNRTKLRDTLPKLAGDTRLAVCITKVTKAELTF